MTSIRFDRMELAGSLGDVGTLLPIAMGLTIVNGLPAGALFLGVGLFYLIAGNYYKVPVAVQPMKVIGAYAIAAGVAPQEIQAAGLLVGLGLLAVYATKFMKPLAQYTPRAAVRGVQVSTGLLLSMQGFGFIVGASKFQEELGASEPFLAVQSLGPLPIGVLLGCLFGLLVLALLENKKLPAGLAAVLGGLVAGLLLGGGETLARLDFGFHLPEFFPFGFPSLDAFTMALMVMVLPQLPMTLGNAAIANADLSLQYFPEGDRVTPGRLCLSMAIANIAGFFFACMPMCHGAGGLAAHYRFGARTSGSNIIIGSLFLVLALFFGSSIVELFHLMPVAVLGVLLVFAGMQLCLAMTDLTARKDLFVVFFMAALSLAVNLAWAFVLGIALAYVLKSDKFSV